MKLILSIVVLATAFLLAGFSLAHARDTSVQPFLGHRPWRKVGAGVCVLVAVMFVLGIYVVDIPERPVPYAIYWIIILGLVVWLFVLAVRDIQYTRGLVDQWRGEHDGTVRPGPEQKSGKHRGDEP